MCSIVFILILNVLGATPCLFLFLSPQQELGITTLGDRKRFMAAIEELQKDHRKAEREKVLWEDKEVLFFSGCDACRQTCCGFCPVDPSEYKLTTHHLTIKTIQPNRCGPCRCCCGNEYEIDNIVRWLPRSHWFARA